MLKPILLGSSIEGKKDAVFIAINSEIKVWQDYQEIDESSKQTIVPVVLMIDRWDGLKGFIGGMVEENEDLFEAAFREFKEEANYDISSEDVIEQAIVASHETDKLVTHLVSITVSPEKLKEIISNAHKAEHFLSEVCGMSAHQFINYPHKKSFDNFINGAFAKTVKEEIADLIIFKGWESRFSLNTDFVNKNTTQAGLVVKGNKFKR